MDSQPNRPRRMVAIDSMILLSRAYHGIPLAFDSENRPNNALRGWFSAWFLIREQLEPDQIIAVFDGRRDLERLKIATLKEKRVGGGAELLLRPMVE